MLKFSNTAAVSSLRKSKIFCTVRKFVLVFDGFLDCMCDIISMFNIVNRFSPKNVYNFAYSL